MARKGAIGGAAVLGTAVLGVSGAAAQCVDNAGAGGLVPFAQGGVVNSIVASINTINTGSLAQSSAFVGSPSNPKEDQAGAGIWSRSIGGTVTTNSDSRANVIVQDVVPPGPPGTPGAILAAGTINCHSTTKQDFVGTQIGFDLARHNFAGGGNMHFGLTAGQVFASTKDRTPGGSGFSSESEIPFMGIYTAIYAGNISFDAQVRWDYMQSRLSDSVQGMFDQRHHAQSTSFLWNASYRFSLPNNWFIDPSIGGVWSRTEVDAINVAGTYVAGNNAGTSPGVLVVDDITSLTGRVSVRAGTTIVSNNIAWQPFAVASVFHEFAGNVTSRFGGNDLIAFPNGGPAGDIAGFGTSSTSRVGTFGHIGVGLATSVLNTGWSGYARVDYRAGDNLEGISVNVGGRYQFAPLNQPAGLKDGHGGQHDHGYSWTGLYAGLNAGAVFGHGDYEDAFGKKDLSSGGYLLGGQFGYNHQFGHMLLGLEADVAAADASGGRECPGGGGGGIPFFFNCGSGLNNLAILGGRAGLVFDRTLLYAKAGLAIGEAKADNRLNGGLINLNANSDAKTMTGWALGAGMEFALTDRWSAKAEYMHYDLGSAVFDVFFPFPADIHVTGDTVRVGLNYHFGK